MKREILFRGFYPDENGPEEITLNGQKIKGLWVEGWYCGKTCDTPFSKARESAQILDSELLWYEVIPETVGQYTGLTDKNVTKIFDGDIVRYNTSTTRADNNDIHEVVFETRGGSGYFGIVISHIETWQFCMSVPAKLMEVIGNIFSNPELIEVEVQE